MIMMTMMMTMMIDDDDGLLGGIPNCERQLRMWDLLIQDGLVPMVTFRLSCMVESNFRLLVCFHWLLHVHNQGALHHVII